MIPIFIVAVVALIFFIGYKREKDSQTAYINELIANYGKPNKRKYSAEEMKALKTYSDKNENVIDDITWNDLDMNLIYKAMNYCLSSSGDEYLYNLLRNPQITEKDWSDWEKKIEGIRADKELRRSLADNLSRMGRTGNFSIHTYLEGLEKVELWSVKSDIILDLMYLVAVAVCFANIIAGLVVLFVVIAFNIGSYFKKKRKIEPYIVCFKYIYRVLKNGEILSSVKSDLIQDELTDLVNTIGDFNRFMKFSGIVLGDLGASPIGIALDYFKMLTHLDLIKFKSMLNITLDKRQQVIHLLELIGKIDCYYSIGEYRQCVTEYCIPELSIEYTGIIISQGYHPLIAKPVTNSIATNRPVLLTGSNASGKSTFLKMVAVNTILAQSIHTCLAKEYKAPYYRIYSSLSLRDSIVQGDSYYMAEIKSLKRIMDAVNSGGPVIGFVDEILRGTNTVERVAASSAILRNLNENKVLVFAATHDIELTSILTEYENYHFEEKMVEDDICFSYELLNGKAVSRNAIRLLELLGYDKKIVAGSKELVSHYEKNGNWS